jgi:23S rRNA pseudouridine1911/1915/1917 synthase
MLNKIIADDNGRIDKYLSEKMDCSRNTIQIMIKKQLVILNGEVVKANAKIKIGDKILIKKEEVISVITKADIPVEIVFEDEHLLIINKQRGLVVHPANGHENDTLVNALIDKISDFGPINGEIRPGIVHRIDKDTSGLLVVAKTQKAHEELVEMLKRKEITRKYLCLVHGTVSYDRGKIDAPIGRDPENRKKMAVTAMNSKVAVTHFVTKERFDKFSLLECTLDTGRTHQIRVHLSHLEHPIVGDQVYGYRRDDGMPGQMLQSYYIEFTHPITGLKIKHELLLEDYISKYIDTIRKEENEQANSNN